MVENYSFMGLYLEIHFFFLYENIVIIWDLSLVRSSTHTHTHTHTKTYNTYSIYMFVYVYMCACEFMCVCVNKDKCKNNVRGAFNKFSDFFCTGI